MGRLSLELQLILQVSSKMWGKNLDEKVHTSVQFFGGFALAIVELLPCFATLRKSWKRKLFVRSFCVWITSVRCKVLLRDKLCHKGELLRRLYSKTGTRSENLTRELSRPTIWSYHVPETDIGFNGAEINCRIAHILGILLMNSCNTDIFFSNYHHLQSVRFELLFCRGRNFFKKAFKMMKNSIYFIVIALSVA